MLRDKNLDLEAWNPAKFTTVVQKDENLDVRGRVNGQKPTQTKPHWTKLHSVDSPLGQKPTSLIFKDN